MCFGGRHHEEKFDWLSMDIWRIYSEHSKLLNAVQTTRIDATVMLFRVISADFMSFRTKLSSKYFKFILRYSWALFSRFSGI